MLPARRTRNVVTPQASKRDDDIQASRRLALPRDGAACMRKCLRWVAVMVALVLIASLVPGQAEARTKGKNWDLAKDFQTAPSQSNPSSDRYGNQRVWSYLAGTANDRRSYRLLPDFTTEKLHVSGLQSWWGSYQSIDEADRLPAVGINKTGQTVHPYGLDWPSNQVLVHPLGEDGAVVMAWRSPFTGRVRITGRAELSAPTCGNGVRWSVRDGSRVVRKGRLEDDDGDTWKVSRRHVKKGDKIYLVVDSTDGDFACDSTLVRLKIRRVK